MKPKFTSTVAGASIFITLTLIIGRGLGLFREIVFANYFGLSSEYDQFLVASVLPITINSILIYLAQNYFIPGFNLRVKKSNEEAKAFTNHSFWIFVGGGSALGLILVVFSELILKFYSGFHSIDPISINVLMIIAFSIPVFAGTSILSAYMQANFKFRSPAVSQLLMNLSIILIVLIFQNSTGVLTIAYGYLVGTILQLSILIYITQKNEKVLTLRLKGNKTKLQLAKTSLSVILFIEIIGQLYNLADRFFLSSVEQGGIAALNYASIICTLPISVFSLAMATAIFPSLSSNSTSNPESMQSQISSFFSVNVFIFVPITIIFFGFGDTLISVLFERGRFGAGDSNMTYSILKIYSFSIIFYSTYAVLNKLYYSRHLLKQLLFISFLGILIKISLNFVLVTKYAQDGLALSSSVSYIMVFIVSYVFLIYNNIIRSKTTFITELIIALLNALISYFLVIQLINTFGFTDHLFSSLFGLIIFILFYTLNSFILKLNSYYIFSNVIRTMINKSVNSY